MLVRYSHRLSSSGLFASKGAFTTDCDVSADLWSFLTIFRFFDLIPVRPALRPHFSRELGDQLLHRQLCREIGPPPVLCGGSRGVLRFNR